MYPTFSDGATDDEKKREVAKFINRKTHIKIAELVEEILKNQLLKAVNEEYIMELRQGVLQYDGVTTRNTWSIYSPIMRESTTPS